MRRSLLIILLLIVTHVLAAQQASTITPDQLIDKYLKNGAWQYRLFSPEWQLYIDSAIAINPNIAYLYQQKAMPLFKQQKYEVGMPFLDKAVELDPQRYIDYRAYMKCIFSKQYRDAIRDFEESKKIKGNSGIVMDHTYDFFLGLCYLQLNEFEKAITFFNASIESRRKSGDQWVHHADLLYMGIAHQELGRHKKAIEYFDWALKNYEGFSDAEYYKIISLWKSGQHKQAEDLVSVGMKHFKEGKTFTEPGSPYEIHPYQIKAGFFEGLRNSNP
jgi:tetratricopeptide (TPR) repeat protein